MRTLEEIKAQAEINQYLGKTASQDEAKDTLKLIEAIEDLLEMASGTRDDGYFVTDLYVHKNMLRAVIQEALS